MNTGYLYHMYSSTPDMMKLDFSTHHSPRKSIPGGNHGGKSRTRPLGSLRIGNNSMDTVPKFPPLTNATKTPRIEPYEGISGNRMNVPPPKITSVSEPSNSRAESQAKFSDRGSAMERRTLSPVATRKQSSRISQRACSACVQHREQLALKDTQLAEAKIREKKLIDEVTSLEQQVEQLNLQISEKDAFITDLRSQFSAQEAKYKELYTSECTKHEVTRQELQSTSYELRTTTERLEKIAQEHETALKDLQAKMDSRLEEERAEKQREISVRDEKLGKLKKQMAEALKGNSWERQQQLDELSKELQRVQEEAELLKMRLKATKPGGGSGKCSNCDVMRTQITSAQAVIREREKENAELKALCSRFTGQLDQQDALLLQFAESKGYKPQPTAAKKKK